MGLIAIALLGVLAVACVSRDVPAGDAPDTPDPPDAATAVASDEVVAPDPPDAATPSASEEEDSDVAADADARADEPSPEQDAADPPPDDPPDATDADDAPEEVAEADADPADDPPADDPPADDAAANAPEDEADTPEEAPVVSGEVADSPVLAPDLPEVVVEPRRPLIVLDAGHGGKETGAHAFGVVERESNLDFAFRVEALLQEAGFDVLLTRRTRDRTRDIGEEYPDAPDFVVNRPDLQARVDLANEAGADLFVSIHSNGANDARASGVEVYWDGQRPHAEANERLALALQESVLGSLRSMAGYRAWDRGIREDSCWETSRWTGECSALFLLGPATEIQRERVVALALNPAALGFAPGQDVLRSRATQMPAALLELLFITNEWEAGVLKNEIARQAIAAGIVQGIERYFAETAALADGDAEGAS